MSHLSETASSPNESELALTIPLPLTRHPAYVYLASLGMGSRQTMRGSLSAIASILTSGECDAMTLDWTKLRYHHTAAVRAVLIEKYSPATVNKMLTALKRVLQEALKLELLSEKDYKLATDLRPVPGSKGLRGRALSRDEIAALVKVCQNDSTPTGTRDAALIALLRGSGVRRRELVNLDLSDFDPSKGAIEVRDGKGGKDRTVYLSSQALKVVLNWLTVRGDAPGPLLCPVNKGKRVTIRRLTSQSVLFILQKRGEEAGVADFSTHDFRRTFISDLLDAGVDLVTVQRLAGHSDPSTSSRYDRRPEAVKRRAVELLDLPGLSE
ncbi:MULTISPECIES: tyrosine-type recombinase/integrase [unclassified Coleofasciculus]|uniref:tyrosine-type recombinase/integrase n=1 Tax=Cyanophyceae TaxID=3028117 RepID=UPI0016865365|nr:MULTISPECIES: tyrosine-type recombinase/integrase [unclassified Coleofasciculus]MBD1889885.1 tyrosine-type recombinase/integrase [Coleofasciculus sp. FACHB-SPT9]MBD1895555.1 tyrosine-type recombinase/integrase [Coleofasciculus sp. FACHB-129]